MRRRPWLLLLLLVGALGATACARALAGAPDGARNPNSAAVADTGRGRSVSPGHAAWAALPALQPPPAPATPPAHVARAVVPRLGVFAALGDPQPFLTLTDATQFGTPLHLLVTAQQPGWVQVLLPVRPNGSLGWVQRSEVDVATVADHVTVDLSGHTLTWERAGQVLVRAPVAVGAPSTPTPPGTFFVTDLIETDPRGEYGPWVVALSGYSEAIDRWNGQPARIAIHGTNSPDTIGLAASNGCVRVANDLDGFLAHSLLPGTPVTIT